MYYRIVPAGMQIGAHSFTECGKAYSENFEPPQRAPDATCELETTPEQAHFYRLSGDWNCDCDRLGNAVARSATRKLILTRKKCFRMSPGSHSKKNRRIADHQLTLMTTHRVLKSPPLCVRVATG